MYDLIIIGSGPAGVTAAIYAARQHLNILVISKDEGGQVAKKAVDIENYPGFSKISGLDLTKVFSDQLKYNNVEIVSEEILDIKKEENKFILSVKSKKNYEAKSIIIASGANPKKLNVEGEENFIGKGVSYCALCDGPVFKNKIVAVIGGGNSGFESAIFLSNYVKKIYILEFGSKLAADQENQDLINKTGKVEVILNAKVLKIEGEVMVGSLTYKDNKTEEEKKIDVEGIFVEIGYLPATGFVKNLVDLSEKNEIIVDLETCSTKTEGLFAAGDCIKDKYKQIIIGAGQGAKAALSAYEYLQKNK